ncbi:hypothetical protein [Oryza sativa Japonica Group]|uniref:Uncharacterized protein n=1 Tax=Oryza sativa subsp. japonica TaxID=39947 RepID=Q5N7H3_ORYSJ|nr:hypothetical protein [Oryza sativa Japonica Group]
MNWISSIFTPPEAPDPINLISHRCCSPGSIAFIKGWPTSSAIDASFATGCGWPVGGRGCYRAHDLLPP